MASFPALGGFDAICHFLSIVTSELANQKANALNSQYDEERTPEVIHRFRVGSTPCRIDEFRSSHEDKTDADQQTNDGDKTMPAFGGEN
jgi:hypothetical protein